MAYGDFDSMKKYCSIIATLTTPESMSDINPEGILKAHLDSQKLEIVRFKYKACLRKERNKKKSQGETEVGCDI